MNMVISIFSWRLHTCFVNSSYFLSGGSYRRRDYQIGAFIVPQTRSYKVYTKWFFFLKTLHLIFRDI